MPAPGPRARGARVHPRSCQGCQPWLRASAASGLVLATQEPGGITGRGTDGPRRGSAAGKPLARRASALAPPGALRDGDLRRIGRPDEAQALPGALLTCFAAAAAREV